MPQGASAADDLNSRIAEMEEGKSRRRRETPSMHLFAVSTRLGVPARPGDLLAEFANQRESYQFTS